MSALFWPIVGGLTLFALVLWACLRRMNALDRREAAKYERRAVARGVWP